ALADPSTADRADSADWCGSSVIGGRCSIRPNRGRNLASKQTNDPRDPRLSARSAPSSVHSGESMGHYLLSDAPSFRGWGKDGGIVGHLESIIAKRTISLRVLPLFEPLPCPILKNWLPPADSGSTRC